MQTTDETNLTLAALLDEAARTGSVHIRRADGQTFLLMPAPAPPSPLDIPGVDLHLAPGESLAAVHEGRERG